MSLFDEEQIMDIFIKDKTRKAREEGRKEMQVEMAKILIKGGKLTLDEISECIPSLTMEELEQIEAEVMNLT
jgi:hypothetical protein